MDFNATWKCDKCGDVRRWDDDDLAGIENSLSSRLDDNEKDIKVRKYLMSSYLNIRFRAINIHLIF